MSAVTWAKPRQGVWFERLEPLKAKPMTWARVYETPSVGAARKYAWRLERQPDNFNLPPGEWEFKGAEGSVDGVPGVFARYVGE